MQRDKRESTTIVTNRDRNEERDKKKALRELIRHN